MAKIVFFVDEGLALHWSDLEKSISAWCSHHVNRIEQASPINYINGGEVAKNDLAILDHVGSIVEKTGLCRHSYIATVGGGAVLDAVGFAASVIHRGIRHIRIPTTVMSQLDSGIGVKNGINRFGQKNFYGTYAHPWAVVNDLNFFQTLEQKDWISGIAEAFKVAIIKDKAFLEFLAEKADNLYQGKQRSMEHLITRCALLHLDHIRNSGDPFEFGSTKPLDFGHWAAHRLEILSDFKLRHGEAVAIGIAIDLCCSVQLGLLSVEECEFVLDAMERCGLPLWHEILEQLSSEENVIDIFKGIEEFRKHQGGTLTLTMPNGLGSKTEIHTLTIDLILNSLKSLKGRKEKSCDGTIPILRTA